ncbi:MAG: CoA transferase [Chloroflexi bacterium]|nr:CoA transferase [Chloroflexota bacterium]
MNPSPSPYSNIRVLEMTEALAGPYCAMLLGDLGADVIKVERPVIGDQSRQWGPPFIEGESAYFLSANRNKRSVALDVKDPFDLELFYKMIRQSDVFITNVPRIESLRRMKMDPDTLRAMNPRLIYVAISGYGHTGPKATRGGYDIIAQGEAGLMAITGGPSDGPIRFPTPLADITAGLYALIGIQSALFARAHSGQGQYIDISLVESQVTWLTNVGGSYFVTGQRPRKVGNQHPTITPYQPFHTKDRMMIVAAGTEPLWKRFCKVLGVEETLMNDPRFATNPQRNINRDQLIPLLEAILATRTADEWVSALVASDIPAGPINFPDETLQDEHLKARGMIVELEHPLVGLVRSIGCPVHLSDTPPTYRRYPPLLGEHNREIMQWLGYAPGEIAARMAR